MNLQCPRQIPSPGRVRCTAALLGRHSSVAWSRSTTRAITMWAAAPSTRNHTNGLEPQYQAPASMDTLWWDRYRFITKFANPIGIPLMAWIQSQMFRHLLAIQPSKRWQHKIKEKKNHFTKGDIYWAVRQVIGRAFVCLLLGCASWPSQSADLYCQSKARYCWNILQKISPCKLPDRPVDISLNEVIFLPFILRCLLSRQLWRLFITHSLADTKSRLIADICANLFDTMQYYKNATLSLWFILHKQFRALY